VVCLREERKELAARDSGRVEVMSLEAARFGTDDRIPAQK
jgi:hypothetical protein